MQNANQEEFRIEKLIKRKDDALYVKWKGYDNSFNSWIDKKDLVWFYRFHCIKMSQFFPKPYVKHLVEILKLKLSFQIMQ